MLIAALLASVALPAQARHDDRGRTAVGAGIGAAVGAALGGELGGRNEAILGGAIGGAVGAAIATDDRRERRYGDYRRARHYDRYEHRRYEHRRYDHGRYERRYHDRGRRHWQDSRRPGPPHCPPGLAKQGRC
jgi:uncharacterized protein YcfJ